MKEILVTQEFIRLYKELPLPVQKRAEKQERLFRQNPLHPSLHTEKLMPKEREVWSFRIDKRYRIIFRFLGKEKVLFLLVGHHNWIYSVKL